MRNSIDASDTESRDDSLRDSSGEWAFDIAEYRTDLNSITPVDISPDPSAQEAYSTAVFLEGFIMTHKNDGSWSDEALSEFESFESTREVEAVTKALRAIAADAAESEE